MNQPTAPGRIRWAVACLAIAASALVPAVAEARSQRVEVIVQMAVGHAAAASAFAAMCPSCIVDGQMIRAGGTSMAAPMISGTVALLLGAFPHLTPNQVKGLLVRNARLINDRYPAVEAYKTLEAAYYGRTSPISTAGLTPNEIVNPATGEIDYSRSSWSRSSWSNASDGLTADFARSSWSRSSWSSNDSAGVDTTRSSWSRSSWSTSWDK